MSASHSWRIFCAVECPPEVTARAAQHIKTLRAKLPDVRASWNRDSNFHLTIKFIGATPIAEVEKISAAAARATTNLSPFNIVMTGAGSFSSKVLWLGIEDPTRELSRLKSNLEAECAREGFPQDDRAFHPHLTIARLRRVEGARELTQLHRTQGFAPMEVTVRELLVIRSELSRRALVTRRFQATRWVDEPWEGITPKAFMNFSLGLHQPQDQIRDRSLTP